MKYSKVRHGSIAASPDRQGVFGIIVAVIASQFVGRSVMVHPELFT